MTTPSPSRRRALVLGVAVAVVAAAGGAAIALAVASGGSDSGASPAASSAAPQVLSTSPADTTGREACRTVFDVKILAPDSEKTMSEADWAQWAETVKGIAADASRSTNREVGRAGEDLVAELKGGTFVPAFVQRAAERLRDACDRADYINIPGR